MKIPDNLYERQALYQRLIEKCLLSRNDRLARYREYRSYYLFGAQEGQRAAYNKIQPTVELLKSFIYSAETTRFNIHLGAGLTNEERIAELAKGQRLREEINDLWHENDTDLIVGDATTWSLVNGTCLIKLLWNQGARPYIVEPENFGVYREDTQMLDRQEAVVHCYVMTRSQLESDLAEHPRREEILAQIRSGSSAEGNDMGFPEGLERLVISQSHPNMVGAANSAPGLGNAYQYHPQVDADLVGMYELYVLDDDIQDYRIVTQADPGVLVYDRKNFGVPRMLPFVKFCPKPLPFYFWGQSFSGQLTMLQDWRTERVLQIRRLMAKQIDPPKALSGFTGITDEKLAALFRPRGIVSNTSPQGRVEEFKPDMPANIFQEIQEIDRMFEDMAGVSHVMQGKGESGVRAKGHADLLARLSSARPKQMALIVEDSLERLSTMLLRLIQQHSSKNFQTEGAKPLTFIAKQFTNDFVVKVDAHSSSAIFVEDKKQDAITLLEAKAIDRLTFLEMFDPPGVQSLKEQLKIRMAEEQKQAQQQMMMEAQQGQKGKANA